MRLLLYAPPERLILALGAGAGAENLPGIAWLEEVRRAARALEPFGPEAYL